jgi:hypothetical protein
MKRLIKVQGMQGNVTASSSRELLPMPPISRESRLAQSVDTSTMNIMENAIKRGSVQMEK